MAQADTAVDSGPAESSGESNYLAALQADADASFAALEEPTQPSAEATTEVPGETSTESTETVAEGSPLESVVDATLAGDDEEPITRRNARELVEKARAEAKEAIEKAQQAESEKQQLQETQAQQQARMGQLLETWGKAGEYSKILERAIAREDWDAIDKVAEKFGIQSPTAEAARGLLVQLDEQNERNGELSDALHQGFIGTFGYAYKNAAERTNLNYDELKLIKDPQETLTRLLDAERAVVTAEFQGKLDARDAEIKALRGKSGALSSSPENGGNGASSGPVPKTVQELQRMSNQDFEKNFDKILAAIPN